jgi:hypothetical protein
MVFIFSGGGGEAPPGIVLEVEVQLELLRAWRQR